MVLIINIKGNHEQILLLRKDKLQYYLSGSLFHWFQWGSPAVAFPGKFTSRNVKIPFRGSVHKEVDAPAYEVREARRTPSASAKSLVLYDPVTDRLIEPGLIPLATALDCPNIQSLTVIVPADGPVPKSINHLAVDASMAIWLNVQLSTIILWQSIPDP
jgi:hypothetical protein